MKNIKKLLSLLLCGIMLFGMFPASLFAADGDTGDGSGTISEMVVPKITWKRTFEYEHRHDTPANQHTDLGGLYAGDKTDYLSTESKTESNVTTYKNKVHWDWAAFSAHFNGRTDDVDDSAHKVWDYCHTDVQYADPVKASITNPINSTSTIGSVGIIPYAPSAGEQAIFAATWNNRAAQDFEASSVDGTGIYSSSNYVSVKKGQMDIGYGKKSSDSTISTFSGKSFTARRFSGSFVWPEGYTLSDSIELISKNDSYYQEIYEAIENDPDLKAVFGGKKVVAINDDMFVFVYKDGDQPTEDNYSDYLAFFAGTAGKGVWSWPNADPQDTNHGGSGVGWGGEWNVTEPATYGDKDKYASKAFYKVLPNLDTAGKDRSKYMLSETLIGKEATSTTTATAGMMALSDYWYSFMDGNAISTVLNNKYGETGIHVGDTVHIDIYCIDMDKAGGMDELEIRLTRQKPTTSTVKVRYWLNEVGEITDTTKYLGETTMTGQEIGSLITLANGTDVNQLNHKRAAAITKANGDVSDGVQIELPFTVTEKSEDNIINVVYVPAGNKVVHLWAGSLEVPYDGNEHVVHNVKITQDGCNDITVSDSETNTWCELNDRDWYKNKITSITAQRKEIYPGIYVVDFARTSKVESYWGEQLNNYSIIYHPGTLKITYAPPAKTFVYDFGVQNSYKLTDVEEKAVGIQTVDETVKHVGFNGTDKSILYTPQSVNKGETIQTKLVFTGNYITEATSITFLPATNVLYEENFMTNRGGTTGEWIPEGTNNTATVVKDNENSVYGYADAYKGFADYSNGGALKATLDLKGGKRAYTTDAVEFSFSGTGFDIISECGTNTGLIIAAVSKDGKPFKVYIVDTYFCGDNSIGGNPPIITSGSILDYQVPVVRAMNLERADYSVRILGYLTDTAGAIIGPANPTPWDGGETGAEGSTRGANGIDTNRILREAGLKEFIGCEVETSFMDENSVLNGGTGIAAKNSQNRTFGKRGEETAQIADVYLDAFRVYQPLENENEVNYADKEKGLKYAPVYDYVKNSANSIGSEILPNSMVYVEYDGDTGIANIAKYQDRGPQNEVYLTNGNYIGFALEGYTEGKTVMISAKAVAGDPVLGYLDTDTNVEGAVIPSGMKMTEMYYDVTACVRRYGAKYMLVLGNIAEAGTGTGTRSILSVSGIKLAKDITPATSTQIAADIASLVTLAYQPVEEPVFTPERFELRYSGRALAGWFTRISVKTSTDVDHVSVYRLADDGSLVPVRENMRPMNSLFTYFGWMDYYAFSLTVRAPRRGMTDTYYIFAYDANGVASEPAIASITGR